MYSATLLIKIALLCALLSSCATPAEVSYAVSTKSSMVCCRTMHFTVANFAATAPRKQKGIGVEVRFDAERMTGSCSEGSETPVVIANYTDEDVLVPTSRELDGARIKLYPWRQHHDSALGVAIRVARQIQYGDLLEHPTSARLRLMRLPAGREVRLTAWVPGAWLCTKPTTMFEGYMEAELEPSYYSQHSRALRTSPYEQASDLITPIGLRYDVVYLTLDFLESLPVVSRRTNPTNDTIAIVLDVKEEPSKFLNASQKVASSNVIELVINK